MYMRVRAHVERLTLGVFLNLPPLHFSRRGLLMNPELTDSARLVAQQIPGIILSLLSQHGDYRNTSP